MSARVLIVATYYPEFLDELYAAEPGLAELPFHDQLERVFATGFGIGDAYAAGLSAAGCDAQEVICNADAMQAQWARERGLELVENIHDRRRQIVAAQIEHYRPDVLFVFEWSPLGDEFLAEMKAYVRLVVGQIACPLPGDRSFAAYDLMLSCWPPLVDYFRSVGMDAQPLRLAFDDRILESLKQGPPAYDVTFVGGFAPSHKARIAWLERLLRHIDIDIFGYGAERVPAGSPIRSHHRGPVWGWRMYEVLQRSRITLHLQATIDVRGDVSNDFAAAMRLYEATGVGTCLVTKWKDNLPLLFDRAGEVVAYKDEADCIEKIKYYLAHEDERLRIARAGQQRTLREHTYSRRMQELAQLLQSRL